MSKGLCARASGRTRKGRSAPPPRSSPTACRCSAAGRGRVTRARASARARRRSRSPRAKRCPPRSPRASSTTWTTTSRSSRAARRSAGTGRIRASFLRRTPAPRRSPRTRGDAGPGAVAADSPADPEYRGTDEEPPIHLGRPGEVEFAFEDRLLALQHQAKRKHRHAHCASEDEREARVPVSGDIQKIEHLPRVHHLGDREAQPEQQARRERARVSRRRARHDATPNTCRTTNTLAIPVTRNASVATIERTESRLIPHTPCPLVQPPPCAVPKPTRTPASMTSDSE